MTKCTDERMCVPCFTGEGQCDNTMTQEQIDQIKADFEEWAAKLYDFGSFDRERVEYGNPLTNKAWLSWQAAHARYAGGEDRLVNVLLRALGEIIEVSRDIASEAIEDAKRQEGE